ncbi:MAG: amine dehydrogenase large subunit [Gammaproteobacteria bacterium]
MSVGQVLIAVFLLIAYMMGAGAAEKPGKVEQLPASYPDHWVIAHDVAFFHMLEGKMMVLDADAETAAQQFKGMVNSSFIGQFTQSAARSEMYVAETFHSRGVRGERTDVVTIYDKATLAPVGEIILPGGKRSITMPEKYALQLIDEDMMLLVFNLFPATSVTVVDVAARKVLNEIPIPGCALIYPTGKRGFSSLCSNNRFFSVALDEYGIVLEKFRSEPFFDSNEDPLFEKPVIADGIAYFQSFHGTVYPVDLRLNHPEIGDTWSLVSETDQGWRPGGWQLNAVHGSTLYILMHPDGHNGSHKDGGPEVWVFDLESHQRRARIELKNWGISLMVTPDANPLMVVTNAEMALDVYHATTGEYLRTLGPHAQETPFVVYQAN